MGKKKSSEVVTFKFGYSYVGPAGDRRYNTMYVEASDQEDAGEIFAARMLQRGLKAVRVASIQVVDLSQQTIPGL